MDMPGDMLRTEVKIPRELELALLGLLDYEAAAVLYYTGQRLIKQERLFERHFKEGQAGWPALSPKYVKWKAAHGFSAEIGIKTGKMRDGLDVETKDGDGSMRLWSSGRKRRLMIGMQKKAGGSNLYRLFQTSRDGVNKPRPIVRAKPSDSAVVESILADEMRITLEKRGF